MYFRRGTCDICSTCFCNSTYSIWISWVLFHKDIKYISNLFIYHSVQYCIVLYSIVFYCIVLYCIVLYCIVLYCIVLYCIVLYCVVLYGDSLHMSYIWYFDGFICFAHQLSDSSLVSYKFDDHHYLYGLQNILPLVYQTIILTIF